LPAALHSATNLWKNTGRQSSPAATAPTTGVGKAASLLTAPDVTPGAVSLPPSLEGAPARDLGEVFRFDVTPGWVLNRWPRVSTGLAQIQFQGYRVPLVTGTSEADLAGILTYYFNAHQQVERITFKGTTGDLRNLVDLLTTRYHFARRLINDPGLLLYEAVKADGQPAGSLRARSATIVTTADPYHRFDLDLVIERP
jgi:hypothetical protein